jgi:hypothetical protein
MINLNDKIWKDLKGGYKVPYDVSVPLKILEESNDAKDIKRIWDELWNELHHQGDVGLASYLALPQLTRIGLSKHLIDWNLLGLCCVIEQQRHLTNNPILPKEYHDYYNNGLKELKRLALDCINLDLDDITYIYALSALATSTGRIKLGKAIIELMDNDIINEFLEQF